MNEQARLGLKAQKLIGEAEATVTALERLDLTDAQKRDKRFYNADSILVFNLNTCGFKAGDTGKLRGVTNKHLLIESGNRIRPCLLYTSLPNKKLLFQSRFRQLSPRCCSAGVLLWSVRCIGSTRPHQAALPN